MAVPSTLYLVKNGKYRGHWTSITDWQHRTWYSNEGVYRNIWTQTGTVNMVDSVAASGTQVAQVDVMGTQGATPTDSAWTTLEFTVPDDKAHRPYRFKRYLHSGTVLAFDSATIPSQTARGHAGTFSASNTTDILTLVGHGFNGEDTVTASISTNGFSTNEIYTIIKLSADTVKLLTPAGDILDVTTGTVSVTLTLVEPAPIWLGDASGLVAVPAKDGILCTEDPRV